jgi:hypothetical protein
LSRFGLAVATAHRTESRIRCCRLDQTTLGAGERIRYDERMLKKTFFLVPLLLGTAACGAGQSTPKDASGAPSTPSGGSLPSFADDLAFLQQHGDVQVLRSDTGAEVVVSAKYQGRVMTSTVDPNGKSFGWIHRSFIESGKTGTAFDNYGGEDRFWLGPEGGQIGLFFAPNAPFQMSAWQTPHELQEGVWSMEPSAKSAVFRKTMTVGNWSGATFKVEVQRTVRVLEGPEVGNLLGVSVPPSVHWVAFETNNEFKNIGPTAWTKDKGAVSIWILGMYNPSPDSYVVVPFERAGDGEIVNDRYFGKIPHDRLEVRADAGYLLFRCDGNHRSKIGIGPTRAMPVLGSYSDSAKLLTIAQFDKPSDATSYVNSMWEKQANPYGGDVVNSYNDGPVEPGKASLGGFYELETSSPAELLAPGASAVHTHRTFHLVGDKEALDAIATKVLHVSATEIARGIK